LLGFFELFFHIFKKPSNIISKVFFFYILITIILIIIISFKSGINPLPYQQLEYQCLYKGFEELEKKDWAMVNKEAKEWDIDLPEKINFKFYPVKIELRKKLKFWKVYYQQTYSSNSFYYMNYEVRWGHNNIYVHHNAYVGPFGVGYYFERNEKKEKIIEMVANRRPYLDKLFECERK